MNKTGVYTQAMMVCIIILSCSTSSKDTILSYQDAQYDHNIDKALVYYTDDIEFEIVGGWVKHGKKEIRVLEERDASVNGSLAFESIHIEKDTAIPTGTEMNDWFKLAGIDTVIYREI